MIEHYEQVSRNVSQTCRFFGISRIQFYGWLGRYREAELAGLRDWPRGPHTSPMKTPPHIEALVLHVLPSVDIYLRSWSFGCIGKTLISRARVWQSDFGPQLLLHASMPPFAQIVKPLGSVG